MLPGLGLGADAECGGINLLAWRRLLAGWSEFEVQMETPLSAGSNRRRRAAPEAEFDSLAGYGEAAHGRA